METINISQESNRSREDDNKNFSLDGDNINNSWLAFIGQHRAADPLHQLTALSPHGAQTKGVRLQSSDKSLFTK